MADDLDLGSCCACGGTVMVRNIIMLDKKTSVPGTGWGCFVCGLSLDGASAVVCDGCLDSNAEIRFAISGYPADKERILISSLTGHHEHDMRYHQGDELPV